jgi:hypothetical protein
LQWHLKGTDAEQVIQTAHSAACDFHRRDYAAWRDLRLALEESCKLPQRNGSSYQDQEPHLLPDLMSQLRDAFFDWHFRSQAPTPDWLEWDVAPDDSRVLRLRGKDAAVGSSEKHEHIRSGVADFLTSRFRKFQSRFLEVERLRLDLRLFQTVLGKSVGAVQEDEIRRRICPACPYPESQQELDRDARAKRRGTLSDFGFTPTLR